MGSPVTALVARLALTTEAATARRLVLSRHAAAAIAIWPGATITSVGSFAQNTSLRGSDLDVVVDIPGQRYRREAAAEWAAVLRRELVAQKVTMNHTSTVISGARVPILNYIDLQDKIGVDVSFLCNSIVNTEYVKGELELRPYMRTMLILLKYWLKNRNMNKVFTGGLGSYALSCTVIGYFNIRKHTKPRKATQEQYNKWLANQDIYYLLVDYLTFWASQWKYAKHMLEPGEGIIYKKGSPGHCGGNQNKLLAIADPTDPTNNVTSGTGKITELRRAMKLLKDKLLVAGPTITEIELSTLLETTGKMFKDGKWAFGRKKNPKKLGFKKVSSQRGRSSVAGESPKGAHIRQTKVLKDTVPRRIQQPLLPQRGGVVFCSSLKTGVNP